jgi:hypothetical protein
MTIDIEVNNCYAPFFETEAKESQLLETLELYQTVFGIAMHCRSCKRKFARVLKERNFDLSNRSKNRGAILG